MHIIASGSRLALELTPTEAAELIEKLADALKRQTEVGGAWFALPVVVSRGEQSAASRLTVRVEPACQTREPRPVAALVEDDPWMS